MLRFSDSSTVDEAVAAARLAVAAEDKVAGVVVRDPVGISILDSAGAVAHRVTID